MALPKAVQAQLDFADEIARKIQEEQNPPPNPDPDPPADPPEPPAPEPAPADPEPEPEPAPAPAPTEDWEHKFRTLQGMFATETARYKAEAAEHRALIEELRSQIEELRKPKPEPEPKRRLVTNEDIERYGEDLIDLARRIAADTVGEEHAELKKQVKTLSEENEALKKQIGSVVERQGTTSRQAYLTALRARVQDFDQINVDPKFLAWLDEVDAMSGLPRRAFLDNAAQSFDVDRTVNIFNAFKATLSKPAPARSSELSKQVTPPRSAATPTPNPDPATRIWTTREIEQFYHQVSQGRFAGKDQERQRLENEINLAVAQGRVRR